MTAAAPRKKANGEAVILAWRMGTSSGTRVRAWSPSTRTGSVRPPVPSSACISGGTRARACSPVRARARGSWVLIR